MGNSEWTCLPREHDFSEVSRVSYPGEALRLFCRRCGWVRDIDREEPWCTKIECTYTVPPLRHERHPEWDPTVRSIT